MRKQFQMSEEQHKKMLDACKPVPYMMMGGHEPISPQERANHAWQQLADELGFVWDTAQAVSGMDTRHFTAEEKLQL